MNINTAVGEIRTHYLNLPEDDLTEGGRFTAEVLEKLVATEREKVLSEVEGWVKGMMAMYEHNIGFEGGAFCERCREIVKAGTPCEQSVYLHTWRKLVELRSIICLAKLAEMKGKL